jgi:16S rRNA processing protein RimM
VDHKGSASGNRLRAGRVGRAHGLDGSFYVTGARPHLLELGTEVAIAGADATAIVRRAGTDRRPIVRVHGVDDRTGAQELRGAELTVAAADAPQLAEGEWWAHELEGCLVVDGERRVGTVTRMLELPSCEVLEVRLDPSGAGPFSAGPSGPSDAGPSGPSDPSSAGPSAMADTTSGPSDIDPSDTITKPLLVPMVRDAIRRVDVVAGVIDVNMDFVGD